MGEERGGRIVAASEMLRPSVGHIQQAEGMTLRAKSSLTIRFPVGISNLLELEGRLLHKIKANRRREMDILTRVCDVKITPHFIIYFVPKRECKK